MKAAVIQFPGSNCDTETQWFLQEVLEGDVAVLWHQETSLPPLDVVILPGGFSYGDYLRPGAIAARCPMIEALRQHVEQGRYLLGICNGFQMLLEAGFLPGTLLANQSCSFFHGWVALQSVFSNNTTPWHMPIAHAYGRYWTDEETGKHLLDEGRIALRYKQNHNASLDNIAGVMSANKRVLGMMPHPERCFHDRHRSQDGKHFLRSFLKIEI